MAGIFGDDINSRADFFRRLAEVRADAERLVQRLPHENPLVQVLRQLQAIEQWTTNGRTPAQAERESLDMGLRMHREYEMTEDQEIADLKDAVAGIHNYVEAWPDDATAADPDNDEYVD